MRIRIVYRRNLDMSEGKLSAQAVHAALGLAARLAFPAVLVTASVVVVQASDTKYNEAKNHVASHGIQYYSVTDAGRTEVPPGTETCFAYLDDGKDTATDGEPHEQ